MSELNDMICAELADVAAELALGVLTGRERATAVAHLDKCDACREDVRQLMATGEQLLELLPPAEPPAGFETRVLERLGLPVSAQEAGSAREETQGSTYPQLISRREESQKRGETARGTRPRADRHGADRHRADRPGTDQPGAPPARPGGTKRPGRMRRVLAATAIGLAVVVAGFGGWRVGLGSAPTTSSVAAPLTTASLRSATGQDVGDVFIYSGKTQWVYMSIDMDSAGNQVVACQLVAKDGQVTQVGKFQLADGYGSWGSPDTGNVGALSGARLVAANGTVLASAAFAT
jgi:hypothetical protein